MSKPNHRSRDQRRPPRQGPPAQKPERPQHATADAVERTGHDRRNLGNRVIGKAHFLEAPLERFRDMNELTQLGKAVAGYPQPHSITAVAKLLTLALVHERMVDAAVGQLYLRLLEQLVRREINRPVGSSGSFGDRARRRRI